MDKIVYKGELASIIITGDFASTPIFDIRTDITVRGSIPAVLLQGNDYLGKVKITIEKLDE